MLRAVRCDRVLQPGAKPPKPVDINPAAALKRARALLALGVPRRLALPGRAVEIALLDWGGAGPLALLHHANGFCKGVLGLLAEGLRPHYRVVAMDARGHGDSSRPPGDGAYHWDNFGRDALAVARVLAAEHGGRVGLGLGHSFGGAALLDAASREPQLFERLALIDPVVPPDGDSAPTPERLARTHALIQGARRRREHWANRDEALAGWASRPIFAAFRPEALALYALDGLCPSAGGGVELKCPGAVEAAVFENAGRSEVVERVVGLGTPTLWLWAQHGDFERARYKALAATMKDARVVTLDAGHLVAMEQPERVLEALREAGVLG